MRETAVIVPWRLPSCGSTAQRGHTHATTRSQLHMPRFFRPVAPASATQLPVAQPCAAAQRDGPTGQRQHLLTASSRACPFAMPLQDTMIPADLGLIDGSATDAAPLPASAATTRAASPVCPIDGLLLCSEFVGAPQRSTTGPDDRSRRGEARGDWSRWRVLDSGVMGIRVGGDSRIRWMDQAGRLLCQHGYTRSQVLSPQMPKMPARARNSGRFHIAIKPGVRCIDTRVQCRADPEQRQEAARQRLCLHYDGRSVHRQRRTVGTPRCVTAASLCTAVESGRSHLLLNA